MENELSHKIIGAAIEVHKVLGGPGFLESIYESALCPELVLQGCKIQRQLPIDVLYKGTKIKDPFFIGIVVDNEVIIEVKVTEKNHSLFESQVLTYLRLTGKRLGLVINFGNTYVKAGICRIVNGLCDDFY